MSLNLPFSSVLKAKNTYVLGEPIEITFTLSSNSSDNHHVLQRYLPLEGIRKNIFHIEKDDEKVMYDGILIKRGNPIGTEYIILEAGGEKTVTVDISKSYPINEAGQYTIELRTHIADALVVGSTEIPRTREAHTLHAIHSDPITFTVLDGGKPRLTVGAQARMNEGRPIAAQIVSNEKNEFSATTSFTEPQKAKKPLFIGGTTAQRSATLAAHYSANIFSWECMNAIARNKSDTNSRYVTWFGAYDPTRMATVYDNYYTIYQTLGSETITYDFTGSECDPTTYAYTYRDHNKIYLCKLYLEAPPLGTDSKMGTLVHELSHLIVDTDDVNKTYGQSGCKKLAKDNPTNAINNADNYEYFTESAPQIGTSEKTMALGAAYQLIADSGTILKINADFPQDNNHHINFQLCSNLDVVIDVDSMPSLRFGISLINYRSARYINGKHSFKVLCGSLPVYLFIFVVENYDK